MSDISSLSKVILVLGKAGSCRGAKSGLSRSWVTWVIWCFTKKLCTRCDAWAGMLSWWSCQSPIAHRCSLLNHPNSSHRGIFKLNTKFDADSLHYLLSHFNAVTTQYTCSLNSVYHPHWLVQWSHHCSHMCIRVHSPWLPGYINVLQSILVILTMAGLSLDRPRISERTE